MMHRNDLKACTAIHPNQPQWETAMQGIYNHKDSVMKAMVIPEDAIEEHLKIYDRVVSEFPHLKV